MSALLRTIRGLSELASSQRKLWVPFLIVAGAELLLITCIWLAPHPPFSFVFAPPVRYFFGDRVLHYPWHIWFLYHAMKHTHIIAATLIGAFMTGVACVMVRQVHEGKELSLRDALKGRQVRYGRVLILWLISWGLAKGLGAAVAQVVPKTPWAIWSIVALTMALQMLMVYAIPAAVYNKTPWWNAVLQSVREAMAYPFSTLAIVAVPSFLVMAFALMASSSRVAQWMMSTEPEIALPLVALRLVVWTVSDAFMTVGIAHLWWNHRSLQLAAAKAREKLSISASRPVIAPTSKPNAKPLRQRHVTA
jgi:hypothetical protein